MNFCAGSETPAAGIDTAIGIAIAAVALTPLICYLPKDTLASTIIVAVLSLVDFSILKKTWDHAGSDTSAIAATILLTLVPGVEIGVASGAVISVFLHSCKTSRRRVAEVGRVPGTRHFRNEERHVGEAVPQVLTLRMDESLCFMNARFPEDLVQSCFTAGCNI